MSESGFFFSLSTTLWPTPTERDHRSVYASPQMHVRNARPLSEAAGRWATPTVADTEGGRANRSKERSGELLIRGQALLLHSRQDPTTLTDGTPSLRSGLTLNPLFVESLMNWPPGWSALAIGRDTPEPNAWTGCVYSAAVLSRWRRLMRSALLQQSLLEPLPAQLDFFG
jgi:hypothetical protein